MTAPTLSARDVAPGGMVACRFRCYGLCHAPSLCRKRDADLTADDHKEIAAIRSAEAAYEAECAEAFADELAAQGRPVPPEQLALPWPASGGALP